MTMSITIETLIREFLGDQPEDCKHANLLRLAAALKASGPVVRDGYAVSARDVGAEVQVDFERRPFAKVPAATVRDEHGEEHATPERDPTDAELAKQWGLPLAADTPLDAPAPAPLPALPTPAQPAPHTPSV